MPSYRCGVDFCSICTGYCLPYPPPDTQPPPDPDPEPDSDPDGHADSDANEHTHADEHTHRDKHLAPHGDVHTGLHAHQYAHADVHVLTHTPGNPDELWCGNDGGLFAIDASTGEVRLAAGQSLNAEAATSHQLTVTASEDDGPGTDTATVSITANDAAAAEPADNGHAFFRRGLGVCPLLAVAGIDIGEGFRHDRRVVLSRRRRCEGQEGN